MQRHLTINILNRQIRYLTASDTFIWSTVLANNFLIALYVEEKLGVEAIKVIAIGAMITFFVRSICQTPVAKYLDKDRRMSDEIYAIMTGGLLIVAAYLLFPYLSEAWHYYVLQLMIGLGIAINLPAWRKTFAASLDEGKEAVEYAVYDSLLTAFTAVFIAVIGLIVYQTLNFNYLFYVSAAMAVFGSLVVLPLRRFRKMS
ncbi:MAG: hypothetical protein QY318_03875 [Candidatus Dojkabacteria bacterium]|nr:MAG: hypothetical protein QY318_03875 [Candidatus Dojkabacteria bacterium]